MNKKFIALVWLMMTTHIGLGMGTEKFSVYTLIYAIEKDDPKLVERVLSYHPDLINSRDQDGNMPLHLAAKAYSAVYVDREFGDLERRSEAKRGKQEEILRALLDAGARPNARDAHYNTPVDLLTQKVATSAHLLLYERGGKSSRDIQEQRSALLKEDKMRQPGKRKRR